MHARGRRSSAITKSAAVVAVLISYRDIGMKRPALALCERLLDAGRLTPETFKEIVITVGMFGSFRRWSNLFAGTSLSWSERTASRLAPIAGCYFAMHGRFEIAAALFGCAPRVPFEYAWHAMKSWLVTGDRESAGGLAAFCERRISFSNKPPGQPMAGHLSAALGEHYFAHSRWAAAADEFEKIPPDHALASGDFAQRAVLARIANAYDSCLRAMKRAGQLPDQQLSLPRNTDAVIRSHLRVFIRLARALRRMLPEEMIPTLEAQALDEAQP